MNKVDQITSEALRAMSPKKCGNTRVEPEGSHYVLTLHGNEIASFDGRCLYLTDAGWQTMTTKNRLNACLETFNSGCRLQQSGGRWWLTNRKTGAQSLWQGEFAHVV